MKKYKLIKKYPNSPELGAIWLHHPLTEHITNNSEFWEEIPEFKVGDYVYCERSGLNDVCHKKYSGKYMDIGVFRVKEFSKDSDNKYQVAISDEGAVVRIEQYGKHFRLATPEEIESYLIKNRFKKDDWVYDTRDGEIFQVTKVSDDGTEIYGSTRYGWNHYSYLRLANKCEIDAHKMENLPKYVKCVFSYGNIEIGKIYDTDDNDTAIKLSHGFDWGKILVEHNYLGIRFIPATKEEYDAQNKPKFKVGDWVYFTGKNKGIITNIWFVGKVGLVSMIENYVNNLHVDKNGCSNHISGFRLATTDEVKVYLLAEAVKRGFTDGIRFKGISHPKCKVGSDVTCNNVFFANDHSESLGCYLYSNNQYIYLDGQWAEIIKQSPFKIGDTVRILADKIDESFYPEAKYYLRERMNSGALTFIVADVCNNGRKEWDNQFIKLKGYNFSHPIDCFELVKEEPIVIAGYTGDFSAGCASFGCKTYSKSEINELIRIMDRFEIVHFNVASVSQGIDSILIRKIRDRIK